MKLNRYFTATTELLLIFPAALFMTALFVRNLQPIQFEPARTAQHIVDWYAARPRLGLWVFLIALPLTVLASGCGTLWHRWGHEVELPPATKQAIAILRTHLSTFLLAVATSLAGVILAIVALHLLTE